MTRLEDRQILLRDIAQARSDGARLASTCALVGLDPRTLQRWQIGEGISRGDRRAEADRPVPSHALSEVERARIIAVVNETRFAETPPARIVPAPADEGIYIASEFLTDTLGLLVAAIVHAADIQDRDGAPRLLRILRSAFPWLRHVFADSAYAGGKLRNALAKLGMERTLAWLNRNRRPATDFEASIESATTWFYIASVKLMSRRLARA